MSDDLPPGMLGVPHETWCWMESALSLVGLAQNLPPGSDVGTMAGPKSVDVKRNRLAELMLNRDEWRWLCMVDSDMICDHRSVLRLLRTSIRTGVGVVGALVTNRPGDGTAPKPFGGWSREATEADDPLRPSDSDAWEFERFHVDDLPEDGDVVEVDWVGTGLILISRPILEALDGPPWFASNLRSPKAAGEAEDASRATSRKCPIRSRSTRTPSGSRDSASATTAGRLAAPPGPEDPVLRSS